MNTIESTSGESTSGVYHASGSYKWLMLCLLPFSLASGNLYAEFPVDLSVNAVVGGPVEYALPTQPGQAIALINTSNRSQLHVFDGSNVTETFKDQFQLLPKVLPGENNRNQQRVGDALLINQSLSALVGASFDFLDTSASGEVRSRRTIFLPLLNWWFVRSGSGYRQINASEIRNALANSSQSYDACATFALPDPTCAMLAAVDGNGNGFWVLRARRAFPNVTRFELARFDFSGNLLELQPLFQGADASEGRVLDLSRDISGVLHVAITDDLSQFYALRIDDRGGFDVTHSGVLPCSPCTPSHIKYAGVGEWIAITENNLLATHRQYALSTHVIGAPIASASLRFQSTFSGAEFQIETSLGGQSVVRYAQSPLLAADTFRWQKADGTVLPTGNWQTADFGVGELLFVTKLVSIDGVRRISANWLDQNGVPIAEDELVGNAPVNPLVSTPVFRADGQLHAMVQFPNAVDRGIEVWRIDADGAILPITSLASAENVRFITSQSPSNYAYVSYRNPGSPLIVQRIDLRSGSATAVEVAGSQCLVGSSLAINDTLLMTVSCGANNYSVYSLTLNGLQFLQNFTGLDLGIQPMNPQLGSPDLATIVDWPATNNQNIVYGVSAGAITPRLLLPSPLINPPILTADGGALLGVGNNVYTKYRANLPPLNNFVLCGVSSRQDAVGNFWSARTTSFGSDVCHTNVVGKRSMARSLVNVDINRTLPAINGDLLLLSPSLVRFSVTPAGGILASVPQPIAANLSGAFPLAQTGALLTQIQQQNTSENPLVPRLRTVLNLRNLPAQPNIEDYLHFDGFEGDQ